MLPLASLQTESDRADSSTKRLIKGTIVIVSIDAAVGSVGSRKTRIA